MSHHTLEERCVISIGLIYGALLDAGDYEFPAKVMNRRYGSGPR